MMKNLAIHFARFGPYHVVRLRSAAVACRALGWNVFGLEIASNDLTYAWEKIDHHQFEPNGGPSVATIFPGRAYESISDRELCRGVNETLNRLKPDAVAIAGWRSVDARESLKWCKKNGAIAILMSETRKADGLRVWWKETWKSSIVRSFDAAIVGGLSHRDYLTNLGMPKEFVELGYDVVDNDYFARQSANDRVIQDVNLYFLASNRFIPRKNLRRLVDAYREYVTHNQITYKASVRAWDLCLLGDGKLKRSLMNHCRSRKLNVSESAPWEGMSSLQNHSTVFFPGFRQIKELPIFAAHAGCFVHPAISEPWGLVINEAMACGLPIISSNNVGAAEELVDQGKNGFTFPPLQTSELAQRLVQVADPSFPRSDFGDASRRILGERVPTEAFGNGMARILEKALSVSPIPMRKKLEISNNRFLFKKAASLFLPNDYQGRMTHILGTHGPAFIKRASEKIFDVPIPNCMRDPVLPLFIHIPKNAGTNISRQIYGRYIGHRTAAWYLAADEQMFMGKASFAVCRDPYDRFISAFNFVFNGGTQDVLGSQKARSHLRTFPSILEFAEHYARLPVEKIEAVDPCFHSQTRYVLDDNQGQLVDKVFHLEHVAGTSFPFAGIEIDLTEKSNTSKQTQVTFDETRLRSLVNSIYQFDYDFFGYAY